MSETTSEPTPEQESEGGDTAPRRSFLMRLGAIVFGGLATLIPVGTGVAALFDPLRKRARSTDMVMVTRLAAIPEDGVPKKFTVETDRVDAWTTYQQTPVGAIYLRRVDDSVAALNVVCPHAGCFVALAPDRSRFACPCHKSSFDLDGVIDDPGSPSPRDMDSLEVEVRNGDEVWVRFQSFQSGRAEKTPV